MSHEIETHDGKAAFVTAREHAWHRLGTVLPETFTAEQAMTEAHLGGWNVRKTPLTAADVTDDGVTTVDVPDKFAMLRTNPFTGAPEALGVVGNQYTAIQNEEHAEFLNTLVDESGAHFETAGSLRGGREVFLSMKVPSHILIGGVDPVDLYLVACNAHDGTQAFRLLVTPVRVVCANTQAAALRHNKGIYSIRHTTNADIRMEEARNALGMTFAYADEFSAEAERMINATMTDAEFHDAVELFFEEPDDLTKKQQERRADEIATLEYLFSEADTQREVRGTRWAAYQAVTEFVDHYQDVRGAKNADDELDKRALRSLSYDAQGIKSDAYEMFAVSV